MNIVVMGMRGGKTLLKEALEQQIKEEKLIGNLPESIHIDEFATEEEWLNKNMPKMVIAGMRGGNTEFTRSLQAQITTDQSMIKHQKDMAIELSGITITEDQIQALKGLCRSFEEFARALSPFAVQQMEAIGSMSNTLVGALAPMIKEVEQMPTFQDNYRSVYTTKKNKPKKNKKGKSLKCWEHNGNFK